ncbi:hypothetical protein [Motilimonas sp. KMU-193]|uniref:hypothetical protein n=1 Tax=Motilimonas sp. KMU-193 TaxID=3388668 RepID=UPI00396B3E6A
MSWPIFCLGLLIGGAGAFSANELNDDDIHLLLQNGPLGTHPNPAKYAYLFNHEESYYRLHSYLLSPRMTISPKYRQDWPDIDKFDKALQQGIAQSNMCYSIATNFPNWFSVKNFNIECLVITTEFEKVSYYGFKQKVTESPAKLTLVNTKAGVDVYLHCPEFTQIKQKRLITKVRLKLQIHAQPNNVVKESEEQKLTAQAAPTAYDIANNNIWVFPAPAMGYSLSLQNKDLTADFSQDKQPYWYEFEV